MGEIDQLIERFPNFRLAYRIRGELLLARAGAAAAKRS
jgi:hypothetical protein